MQKPTVVQKLDHVVSMLKQADNPKFESVLSTILLAKARIQNLEERLEQTETMHDRIAMQLLPDILRRHTEWGARLHQECIRQAYALAGEVLTTRKGYVQ